VRSVARPRPRLHTPCKAQSSARRAARPGAGACCNNNPSRLRTRTVTSRVKRTREHPTASLDRTAALLNFGVCRRETPPGARRLCFV
jgi:hypothetical protein